MKPKALTRSNRTALRRAAERLIDAAVDVDPAKRAAWEDALRAFLVERFPPSDMAVLMRYGAASAGPVYLVMTRDVGCGTHHRYWFSSYPPVTPGTGRWIEATDELTAAYEEYHREVDRVADERKRRKDAYGALIDAARTFDDVLAVWPDAPPGEVYPDRSVPAVVLTDEVRATVAADVAERAARA